MIGEEIDLNPRLSSARDSDVVETDLGEYILQLRGETPSHIVAPAIHLTREQIAEDFKRHHENETIPPRRDADVDADALVAEARAVMRRRFLAADAGITGANVLIAENGAAMIVTQRGKRRSRPLPSEDAHYSRLDREGRPPRSTTRSTSCAC